MLTKFKQVNINESLIFVGPKYLTKGSVNVISLIRIMEVIPKLVGDIFIARLAANISLHVDGYPKQLQGKKCKIFFACYPLLCHRFGKLHLITNIENE